MTVSNYGVVTPLDSHLAQALERERSNAGIRMQDLADHLDWSYVSLTEKMRGVRPLYVHDLVDIASAIGADTVALLAASMADSPSGVQPIADEKRRRCQVCGKPIPGDAHPRQIYHPGACANKGLRAQRRQGAPRKYRRRTG